MCDSDDCAQGSFAVFGFADDDFVGVQDDEVSDDTDSSTRTAPRMVPRPRRARPASSIVCCAHEKRIIRVLRRRLSDLESRHAACKEGTVELQEYNETSIYELLQQHQLADPPPRTFGYDWAKGFVAPFVAAEETAIHSALDAIGPIGHTDCVVDLGCGDGRILIQCAATFGTKALGVDLDSDLLEKARRDAEAAGVSSLVNFEQRDLFDIDLSKFTAVLMFLLPPTLETLRPRLEEALTSGASRTRHVVSFKWPINGLEHMLIKNRQPLNSGGAQHQIYCYAAGP
jgi:hypothetical protein